MSVQPIDHYRAYRAALTRFANLREELVWSSSFGIDSIQYRDAKRKYEKARINLNRHVEELIIKSRNGEL